MLLPADPKAGYLAHKETLDKAIRETMESGWYILGPKVALFEEHFAEFVGASSCIGVGSGTDAVHLALRACGVGPGDGVLTVSHTAVATVSAIDWIGARPVLVDISPYTYTLDPQKAEDTLKKSPVGTIKAIVAVHIYGHPADMKTLLEIAERYGVVLIEDCAQAHGAMVAGKTVGSIGDCGAFSFYPTKNLGAFGDGGAVVTSQVSVTDRLRLLQQYGWRERYISVEAGYNSRLDELQAAILNCKLTWLDSDNNRRREIARLYTEGLSGLPLETPIEAIGYRHVYHQYVIRLKERDRLKQHLENQGIRTAILYPQPVHLQLGYSQRVTIGEGGMAHTEQAAHEILCLPIYPELSESAVSSVIDAISSYFK
ncbi:MAG: DegT/DnrJ/EryC1/StrS family aminotransferase [Chlorobium sp.]|nr:DegT/DnrJ/EryC1/StrS family aminotransferase [Chlorobium sp.]